MLGDPVTAHFALQESNLDMMHHAFPQIVNSGTAHAFDTQFHNTIQEDHSVEQENIHYHIPHILGEDLSNSENRTVVEELSQQLPVDDDLFRGCSNFDGNDVLSSPVPECSLSFHNLEFSSPLPEMPIWRMDEGISGPDNPNNLGLCDKDLHPGCNSEFQYVSSTSVLDLHPEVKDGTVCCVLNTEDTEIPFNDDIAFPTDWRPRSVASLTQGFAFGGSTQFKSADTKMETLVPAKLKEETTETPLTKHTSHDSTEFFIREANFYF
ncbi:hypothetical protein OIU77_026070 [Salix suchowensis]|uniref:Uncharacterized protein n=1 Tax=Salix suchowensis TaxID=1278906 RepID=A0ABQ9C078_9ROSI|nr:hypothetical protein OIU77_026070 [Salix suchowensis]